MMLIRRWAEFNPSTSSRTEVVEVLHMSELAPRDVRERGSANVDRLGARNEVIVRQQVFVRRAVVEAEFCRMSNWRIHNGVADFHIRGVDRVR